MAVCRSVYLLEAYQAAVFTMKMAFWQQNVHQKHYFRPCGKLSFSLHSNMPNTAINPSSFLQPDSPSNNALRSTRGFFCKAKKNDHITMLFPILLSANFGSSGFCEKTWSF